ncbi:MAG TPA: CHASE domain-containing protein [Oscillatoriaceae cyanobacterium M33_DOE_052]|nr:CHASE domain-containing protein [Oscillatoriaceae cyanobacterium M33_DOE_052]
MTINGITFQGQKIKSTEQLRRYLPVGLAIALGVGLTLGASTLVRRWENQQVEQQFQQKADSLAVALLRNIEEYSQVTAALGAFFDAAPNVSRSDFQIFVNPFLKRYPAIRGTIWVLPVADQERTAYEQRVQREGFANFRLLERDEQGKFFPATKRPEYFAINYAEPLETYQSGIGFDLGSDDKIRPAVEKARDTGEIAASGRIVLFNGAGGFALYRPVYRRGQLQDTPAQRRQSLQGIAYTVYQISQVVERAILGLPLKGNLDFYIKDMSIPNNPEVLIFYDATKGELRENQPKPAPLTGSAAHLCGEPGNCTRNLTVADRQWQIEIRPAAGYFTFQTHATSTVVLVGGLLLSTVLGAYLFNFLRYTAEIESERHKSEMLLLNILPEAIASRLKQDHQTIAESFPEVTVLFADIVGFTQLSVRVSPTELVHLLNQVFSTFDRLSEKHGLEKIKTIGDAYMAVGGLPKPRPDHADAVAEMALEMQSEIARFNADNHTNLSIRIGINTGPVVAGVIGKKKFIYDLWGDAVNTASRMESHGLPDAIHVTDSTYQLLQEKFILEARGIIQIKGKGEMATYLLKGRKDNNIAGQTPGNLAAS